MITVMPKVTSSELNGLTAKRMNTQCMAMPKRKNPGTITSSVNSGSMAPLLES